MPASYKLLYRRLARLPLDAFSGEHLRNKLRGWFQRGRFVDRRKYDHAVHVMDALLEHRKFLAFPALLDLVYKYDEPTEPWVEQFRHTNYTAFKRLWPHVHLIDEFGASAHVRLYYAELAKQEPVPGFLLMAELNLADPDCAPLVPLGRTEPGTLAVDALLREFGVFYAFLARNYPALLLGLKLSPLEVTYEPNRFGYPHSVAAREIALRRKVNAMKALLHVHVPLQKTSLDSIIRFIREEAAHINPHFFRYMVRKREHERATQSVSFYERKYVRHKQLIPDERSIAFHYRRYATRQFYRGADGTYCMSPMRSVYD